MAQQNNERRDKMIVIERTGSPIRCTQKQRATLVGLGLKRNRQRVTLPDNLQIRGMVNRVHHLVRVVEGA